jgi:hypothetical protein
VYSFIIFLQFLYFEKNKTIITLTMHHICLFVDKLCSSIDNRYGDDYNHNSNNHHHPSALNRSSESVSQRGSETEDFSESDCEKDIDICDDDNKVTSSSVETPVSVKDFEDDEGDICSPGERSSPGVNSPGPDDTTTVQPPANRSSKKSKSQKKVEMKGRCNCEELLLVNCHLETKELWDKFHDLGTEMIITKTGRYV